jgi:hypothetical protein
VLGHALASRWTSFDLALHFQCYRKNGPPTRATSPTRYTANLAPVLQDVCHGEYRVLLGTGAMPLPDLTSHDTTSCRRDGARCFSGSSSPPAQRDHQVANFLRTAIADSLLERRVRWRTIFHGDSDRFARPGACGLRRPNGGQIMRAHRSCAHLCRTYSSTRSNHSPTRARNSVCCSNASPWPARSRTANVALG